MRIEIPGTQPIDLHHIVCDYNGTIAYDGQVIDGVRDRFASLADVGFDISVITADTHGTAAKNVAGMACKLHVLASEKHDEEKASYVKSLNAESVIAFGNGRNDRKMLSTARLGVALLQGEGLCTETLQSSDLLVKNICDGLDLLLNPKRLIATLRV